MSKSCKMYLEEETNEPMVMMHARVPIYLIERARKVAVLNNRSLSAVIRASLEKMVDDMIPAKIRNGGFELKEMDLAPQPGIKSAWK